MTGPNALAKQFENLNLKWRQAEDHLKKWYPTHPIWVDGFTEESECDLDEPTLFRLGFSKGSILWVSTREGDEIGTRSKRLLDSSVELRLAFIGTFPKLLKAVEDASNDYLQAIQEGTNRLGEYLGNARIHPDFFAISK